MTTEWKDLPTLQDVAEAQAHGWEIECYGTSGSWCSWNKVPRHTDLQYRGRPRQPVMKKVKMLCWLDGMELHWASEAMMHDWTRVPSEDKEIEVPE